MTTIDLTAAGPVRRVANRRPAAPATRLRLTVRGRRVLAVLAALPAVAALSAAILSGGSAIATSEAGAPAGTYTTVTVAPGDTLWSLAQDIAPNEDPRDVVDAIIDLNLLDSGSLVVGQQLALPLTDEAAR